MASGATEVVAAADHKLPPPPPPPLLRKPPPVAVVRSRTERLLSPSSPPPPAPPRAPAATPSALAPAVSASPVLASAPQPLRPPPRLSRIAANVSSGSPASQAPSPPLRRSHSGAALSLGSGGPSSGPSKGRSPPQSPPRGASSGVHADVGVSEGRYAIASARDDEDANGSKGDAAAKLDDDDDDGDGGGSNLIAKLSPRALAERYPSPRGALDAVLSRRDRHLRRLLFDGLQLLATGPAATSLSAVDRANLSHELRSVQSLFQSSDYAPGSLRATSVMRTVAHAVQQRSSVEAARTADVLDAPRKEAAAAAAAAKRARRRRASHSAALDGVSARVLVDQSLDGTAFPFDDDDDNGDEEADDNDNEDHVGGAGGLRDGGSPHHVHKGAAAALEHSSISRSLALQHQQGSEQQGSTGLVAALGPSMRERGANRFMGAITAMESRLETDAAAQVVRKRAERRRRSILAGVPDDQWSLIEEAAESVLALQTSPNGSNAPHLSGHSKSPTAAAAAAAGTARMPFGQRAKQPSPDSSSSSVAGGRLSLFELHSHFVQTQARRVVRQLQEQVTLQQLLTDERIAALGPDAERTLSNPLTSSGASLAVLATESTNMPEWVRERDDFRKVASAAWTGEPVFVREALKMPGMRRSPREVAAIVHWLRGFARFAKQRQDYLETLARSLAVTHLQPGDVVPLRGDTLSLVIEGAVQVRVRGSQVATSSAGTTLRNLRGSRTPGSRDEPLTRRIIVGSGCGIGPTTRWNKLIERLDQMRHTFGGKSLDDIIGERGRRTGLPGSGATTTGPLAALARQLRGPGGIRADTDGDDGDDVDARPRLDPSDELDEQSAPKLIRSASSRTLSVDAVDPRFREAAPPEWRKSAVVSGSGAGGTRLAGIVAEIVGAGSTKTDEGHRPRADSGGLASDGATSVADGGAGEMRLKDQVQVSTFASQADEAQRMNDYLTAVRKWMLCDESVLSQMIAAAGFGGKEAGSPAGWRPGSTSLPRKTRSTASRGVRSVAHLPEDSAAGDDGEDAATTTTPQLLTPMELEEREVARRMKQEAEEAAAAAFAALRREMQALALTDGGYTLLLQPGLICPSSIEEMLKTTSSHGSDPSEDSARGTTIWSMLAGSVRRGVDLEAKREVLEMSPVPPSEELHGGGSSGAYLAELRIGEFTSIVQRQRLSRKAAVAQFLRQHCQSLFAGWGDTRLLALAHIVRERRVTEPGSILWRQGEPADGIVIVQEGCLDIVREERLSTVNRIPAGRHEWELDVHEVLEPVIVRTAMRGNVVGAEALALLPGIADLLSDAGVLPRSESRHSIYQGKARVQGGSVLTSSVIGRAHQHDGSTVLDEDDSSAVLNDLHMLSTTGHVAQPDDTTAAGVIGGGTRTFTVAARTPARILFLPAEDCRMLQKGETLRDLLRQARDDARSASDGSFQDFAERVYRSRHSRQDLEREAILPHYRPLRWLQCNRHALHIQRKLEPLVRETAAAADPDGVKQAQRVTGKTRMQHVAFTLQRPTTMESAVVPEGGKDMDDDDTEAAYRQSVIERELSGGSQLQTLDYMLAGHDLATATALTASQPVEAERAARRLRRHLARRDDGPDGAEHASAGLAVGSTSGGHTMRRLSIGSPSRAQVFSPLALSSHTAARRGITIGIGSTKGLDAVASAAALASLSVAHSTSDLPPVSGAKHWSRVPSRFRDDHDPTTLGAIRKASLTRSRTVPGLHAHQMKSQSAKRRAQRLLPAAAVRVSRPSLAILPAVTAMASVVSGASLDGMSLPSSSSSLAPGMEQPSALLSLTDDAGSVSSHESAIEEGEDAVAPRSGLRGSVISTVTQPKLFLRAPSRNDAAPIRPMRAPKRLSVTVAGNLAGRGDAVLAFGSEVARSMSRLPG